MAVFTGQAAPTLQLRTPKLALGRVSWSRTLSVLALALAAGVAGAFVLIQSPLAARAAPEVPLGPTGAVFAVPDASTVAFPAQDDAGPSAF
ncbi:MULTISPECIES: hypothetical protein [Ramlibacter]|uniref:Uncharacterized protein n=1 Tax=Ramlibacter aquaticus TaxID=2780094 RepID=A0ABR9SJG1_9BURK|nr:MULTISPECIES: hypothetical protein [Ramlibacter]MBE7942157.1 hypothetical protein [Ramlibacter aquaticus]